MQKIVAEYIWIDGSGELRSKIRIISDKHVGLHMLPTWTFDGSSTKQAPVDNSEVVLRPVAMYNNPFHKGGLIVLCETLMLDDNGKYIAHQTNTRHLAADVFNAGWKYDPWFGLEQEYYIFEVGTRIPYKCNTSPGKYYCSTNSNYIRTRNFAEAHMDACIEAGLDIVGISAEKGPSQWKYRIGPILGICAADQLWVSRFVLCRLAEKFGVEICLDPKPLGTEWPGSACYTTFSTRQMRMPEGHTHIRKMLDVLKKDHTEHVKICGEDTVKRLTGEHDTAMYNAFSWGIGRRNVSVRIPKAVHIADCGYIEDRRPSANVDPYRICASLLASAITSAI